MLLQRHLFYAPVPSKNAPTASGSPSLREEWQPCLPRRKRLKLHSTRQVHTLTIVRSQRVFPTEDKSKDAGRRVSDGAIFQPRLDSGNFGSDQAGNHSLLDDSDVRIPEKKTDSDHASPRTRSSNSVAEYARSGLLSDRARVSVERFAMAGRELVKTTSDPRFEDGLYYNPKVGDYVLGTVTSGNYGKLDIDIGAGKLAHLFRRDVLPVEICNVREMSWAIPGDSNGVFLAGPCLGPRYVYDEEVLSLGFEVSMVAEMGTVFTLEVKGFSPAGAAVLSARSVARFYAWQRVRQLHEHKAILKVQITEWTPAGLVARIEGLRAFLPFYYLLNRSLESSRGGSHSVKEYVGQTVSVTITSVEEARSNLVISEKNAWLMKNAYVGALVDGIITDIHTYGLHIRIKNTELSGILHISNISRARIDNIECLFCVGEQVRVMVVPSKIPRKLSFSTADLEMEDGLMLRDKAAVYRGAEEIAAEIARAYEKINSVPAIDSVDDVDGGEQDIVIANWDWLDFGDKTRLDYNSLF